MDCLKGELDSQEVRMAHKRAVLVHNQAVLFHKQALLVH